MTKFFDKTFFRFLFGFFLVLLASFTLLFFINSRQQSVQDASLRSGTQSEPSARE